ncbi:hypothetical protein Tco_0654221 [Tanacetum coccineum]|uniref:Uncharacterized protein n=1 Tax=Tanacetum coccineum TaxID=301880 RepID=A0ABQ4X2U9_9ASTR
MAALTADPNAPGEVVVVRGCDSRGGGCRGVRGDDGVGGVVVEMMMMRLWWWISGKGDGSEERVVDEWRLVVLVLVVGGSEAGDDEGVKKSNTSDHGTTFIDVAATFGVPLTTVGDLQKLINDIDAGKHDELLSEFTNEDRYGNLESNSSMCNDSWGRSSFARCLIKVNSEADLVDVVTIGIPSLSKDNFTKETIRVDSESSYCFATQMLLTPNAEKTNNGFQMVGKKNKRKGKSKSTNGDQFTGLSVKHNVKYEPKATTSAPKKGTTYVGYTSQSTPMLKTTGNSSKKDNLSMSNSFSTLNEEKKKDLEIVVR